MTYIDQLRAQLKGARILETDLDLYSTDKTPGESAFPHVVVIPKTKEDVQVTLQVATANKVPVTVRGAGTGTTGGALATEGGIILSFEEMDRVLDFDKENKMIVVEPGLITGNLQTLVEKENLFYPPDPQSLETCTIGGNVAENAGGPRALKYGVTGHYVIGLAGYYMDGTPFRYGGKQLKNVAGFDLKSVLVGSEGTLAVITEITLRLRSLPKYSRDILLCFSSYKAALTALSKVQLHHIEPATAEFLDPFCFEAVARYMDLELPYQTDGPSLLIEVDGNSLEQIDTELNDIVSLANACGVVKIDMLETDEKRRFTRKMRQNFSLALTSVSTHKKSEDVVVPPSAIADYLETLNTIGSDLGLKLLGYGHLGDGNIHVNILDMGNDPESWVQNREEAVRRVMSAAVDCGGTITGEHGIGITKKRYLNLIFSQKDMDIMKGIKTIFDPEGLLNPGTIF